VGGRLVFIVFPEARRCGPAFASLDRAALEADNRLNKTAKDEKWFKRVWRAIGRVVATLAAFAVVRTY